MRYRTEEYARRELVRVRRSGIAILAVISIVAILIVSWYAQHEMHLAQCNDMLSRINDMKGSWSQNLLNSNGINDMFDRYNAECGDHPTNYSGNSSG